MLKGTATERMVLSSYEKADNDGPGNGRSQMEGDDAERTGREHQESNGSGEGEANGDAEGEAVSISQERGGGSLGGEKTRRGYVYFCESLDMQYIKIGFSANVTKRIALLGTIMPIRLIGYFPACPETERWLHNKFAADRKAGEWFQSNPSLLGFISMLGLIEPEPEAEPTAEPEPEATEPEPESEPEPELLAGQVYCFRCGHVWLPRITGRPRQCPACHQAKWDVKAQPLGRPRKRKEETTVGLAGGN